VPCQTWSIAGKRKGFEDERGNTWWDFGRVLKAKQPKYFVAENVKGILSHNKGESFCLIIEKLIDCGYDVDFKILNTKDYGIPQNRERVIIIGKRKDLNTWQM
jgi:DNA (cytosine-5)-methyltransferase 1